MSELQNRIMQRLGVRDVTAKTTSAYDRKKDLLTAALDLFHAAGGRLVDVDEILESYDPVTTSVADAVANMMVETAALSQSSDLDMVQAAYNWIDRS